MYSNDWCILKCLNMVQLCIFSNYNFILQTIFVNNSVKSIYFLSKHKIKLYALTTFTDLYVLNIKWLIKIKKLLTNITDFGWCWKNNHLNAASKYDLKCCIFNELRCCIFQWNKTPHYSCQSIFPYYTLYSFFTREKCQ